MAGTDRSTCTDVSVVEDVSGVEDVNGVEARPEGQALDVSRYNFFQLVELLNQLAVAWQGAAPVATPANEAIRFKSTASLAFPTRDVIALDTSARGQFELEVSFLGLHGSQSPLPGYYLDSLAWEDAQNENRLTDFMNVFNHRLLTLLHQIWRKYRYYICFDNGGDDAFSQRMFSLVGLGSEVVRNKLQINHSKMLAYAGLLASPGRAPEVICSLVSHCFNLPDITLHSWQLRKVDIAPSQQNRLGTRVKVRGKKYDEKSVLGVNFSIGSRVADRSGKFLLCINKLTREQFLSFLPNGANYASLVMFVAFIMRDQFAWDLRLGLAEQQVGGMVLGTEQNSLLGWTSILGDPEQKPSVTIGVME
ncbi:MULTISPECIES: type VI secretion system baseplate subunit TssG [Yersinia pseudotuberculosis complex]|uniref:Type VI secretion protein n=2 Tax=Yersinia pseudotuberculosis complex TaxID=1649845 RepID=A0A380Q3H4_YERPU|nr:MULTISPECIES: type VI secretion system baseplate subunit TssG [Yersinia pseudotuberculosis complex]CNC99919.1 type VI secretion protein [Yersinia pseudotuberculosis]CRG51341.1 type VI secretion protein [Yersinia wautersii]SUP80343.1 type VI secretion protein [Yersinia pseudotuberculosis]